MEAEDLIIRNTGRHIIKEMCKTSDGIKYITNNSCVLKEEEQIKQRWKKIMEISGKIRQEYYEKTGIMITVEDMPDEMVL